MRGEKIEVELRVNTAGFVVCDECGNDSWYIVGPNPHGKMPLCQVQICTKCGFAVRITYKLVSAARIQISNLGDLLAKIGDENKNGQNSSAIQGTFESRHVVIETHFGANPSNQEWRGKSVDRKKFR